MFLTAAVIFVLRGEVGNRDNKAIAKARAGERLIEDAARTLHGVNVINKESQKIVALTHVHNYCRSDARVPARICRFYRNERPMRVGILVTGELLCFSAG